MLFFHIELGWLRLTDIIKLCYFVCSGNRQQQFGSSREDSHDLLEAQHAELKRKVRLADFALDKTLFFF